MRRTTDAGSKLDYLFGHAKHRLTITLSNPDGAQTLSCVDCNRVIQVVIRPDLDPWEIRS